MKPSKKERVVAQYPQETRSFETYIADMMARGRVRVEVPTPPPFTTPEPIPNADLDRHVDGLRARAMMAGFILQSHDTRSHPQPGSDMHPVESPILRSLTTEIPPSPSPSLPPANPPSA